MERLAGISKVDELRFPPSDTPKGHGLRLVAHGFNSLFSRHPGTRLKRWFPKKRTNSLFVS